MTSAKMALIIVRSFPIEMTMASVFDDIVLRTKRESGNIFDRAVLADNQDVMLPVTASARLTLRNHDHGFHGYNHSRRELCFYVLAKFDTSFATIVVAQNAEAVTITE